MRRAHGSELSGWTRAALEADGFTGWTPFAQLKTTRPPRVPGVYVVLRAASTPVEFLQASIGGWFKGLDPTVAQEILEADWVDGATVVYVGKAKNLRTRLGQYRRYGEGKPAAHQGGRYIWQLADSSELLVAWLPSLDEAPQILETRLIAAFRAAHSGYRPFANLKD